VSDAWGDGTAPAAPRRGEIPWRRWSIALHRDVGYLTVALTIAYAISGIAVNHIADWNPNCRVTKTPMKVPSVTMTSEEGIVPNVMKRLNLTKPPRSSFRPDPNTVCKAGSGSPDAGPG